MSEYDEARDAYLDLADEMNDADVGPWVESDWDPIYVELGRRYAAAHSLPWPPGCGDFDRAYERGLTR